MDSGSLLQSHTCPLRTDLRDACHGDRSACARVYDSHAGALLKFAHWLGGGRNVGMDVVHEVFVQIMDGRVRYDPGKGEPRAFLLTLTRHRLIDALRRSGQVLEEPAHGSDEPGEAVADEKDPMEQLVQRRRAEFVLQVLRQMPFALRELLVLREFQELDYESIGQLLGLPLGTVKSRLARARAAFHEAYKDQLVE